MDFGCSRAAWTCLLILWLFPGGTVIAQSLLALGSSWQRCLLVTVTVKPLAGAILNETLLVSYASMWCSQARGRAGVLMCMCVSHKSPTAQKLVSCTEISCLDNQTVLMSLCLSCPWHKTHGTSMWSHHFQLYLHKEKPFLFLLLPSCHYLTTASSASE